MSTTDEPTGDQPEDRPDGKMSGSGSEQVRLPNLRELRWPVVQALREFGRAASDIEIAERVADAMGLTQRQRTELIPSEQETKLKNRVGWTVHELKEIDVLHYPEPGRRALTPLGMEINEDQINELRDAYKASKSSSGAEQPEDHEQTDPPTAWRIRAGGEGQRYDYNIEHGLACLGFGDHADLRGFSSKQDLLHNLQLLPDAGSSSDANQLWRMRDEVRLGDLVVMPSKKAQQVALGTVTHEYWYDDSVDVDWGRHVVSVDWKRTVPGTALKQDLRASIGGQLSICSIARNDAARRLQQLMETGQDPGPQAGLGEETRDVLTLVEQFMSETSFPTEAHLEQRRLREEWAKKLSAENVASLSREDLLAYTTNAVDYGDYVDRGEGRRQQFILDLDDAEYDGRARQHPRSLLG